MIGRSVTQRKNVSAQTAMDIDNEIRAVIDRCYNQAKEMLVSHREMLDAMAEALMKFETIDSSQIDDIMAGRPAQVHRLLRAEEIAARDAEEKGVADVAGRAGDGHVKRCVHGTCSLVAVP